MYTYIENYSGSGVNDFNVYDTSSPLILDGGAGFQSVDVGEGSTAGINGYVDVYNSKLERQQLPLHRRQPRHHRPDRQPLQRRAARPWGPGTDLLEPFVHSVRRRDLRGRRRRRGQ